MNRRYKFDVEWNVYDKNMKKINENPLHSTITLIYTQYYTIISIKPIASDYLENVYMLKSSPVPLNSYSKSKKYHDVVFNIGIKRRKCDIIIVNDNINIYFNKNYTGNINIVRKDLIISQ